MAGWVGHSGVCFPSAVQAARTSCAADPTCQGITGESFAAPGGALAVQGVSSQGTALYYVQPCERLEPEFFQALLPVAVLASVVILAARRIWAMFNTHT